MHPWRRRQRRSRCKADNGSLDVNEAAVGYCQPINGTTLAGEADAMEDCREEYTYRRCGEVLCGLIAIHQVFTSFF